MNIRKAQEKDLPKLNALLQQVLQSELVTEAMMGWLPAAGSVTLPVAVVGAPLYVPPLMPVARPPIVRPPNVSSTRNVALTVNGMAGSTPAPSCSMRRNKAVVGPLEPLPIQLEPVGAVPQPPFEAFAALAQLVPPSVLCCQVVPVPMVTDAVVCPALQSSGTAALCACAPEAASSAAAPRTKEARWVWRKGVRSMLIWCVVPE